PSVTVRNTEGVTAVSDVPADAVGAQIRAVASDIGVDAAKTGMLSSVPIIEAVADAVRQIGVPNLVVDPVFVSKHGDPLLRSDAVDALRRRILPLAALVTPNLPEAAGLAGFVVTDSPRMEGEAQARLELLRGKLAERGLSDDEVRELGDLERGGPPPLESKIRPWTPPVRPWQLAWWRGRSLGVVGGLLVVVLI